MNQTNSNEVILGDILRLALPLKTTVVGGASEARRPIRWVILLTSWFDLPEQVKHEDLVIVPLHLQEQLTVADFSARLTTLAKLSAAAVIVFRNVPSSVAQSAGECNLPLIITPPDIIRTRNPSGNCRSSRRSPASHERKGYAALSPPI